MRHAAFPLMIAALAGAVALATSAGAQGQPPASAEAPAGPPPNGDPGATPIQGDHVYKAFHERAGIERVAATTVDLSAADPRISDIFKNRDLPHLKLMLADQLCYILGGPCKYAGKDMKTAHKDMGVRMADFNALVENLQKAMDKEGVPFRDQNRLLAKLAPQERVVVER